MSSTATPNTSATIRYLTHIIYWPLYLSVIFPIHAIIKLALYFIVGKSPLTTILLLPVNLVLSYRYLYFMIPFSRFKLFIRNSWILTPSDILPWMMETKEYNEDSTVERQTNPRNWDTIRRQVYRSDDYTCQCCNAKGGPHGDTELHADHVMPVSRNGSHKMRNLRTLCRMCHQARHCRFFK